jgi:hypothetical protein
VWPSQSKIGREIVYRYGRWTRDPLYFQWQVTLKYKLIALTAKSGPVRCGQAVFALEGIRGRRPMLEADAQPLSGMEQLHW